MPYVRITPAFSPFAAPSPFTAPSDPVIDFLSAALGESPKTKPAQCRTGNSCARRTRLAKRVVSPDFDVYEQEHEYVLEGELPGVSNKSSILVDFDDAQTIVIKGEIKRASRNESQKEELTEATLQASAQDAEVQSQAETLYETPKPKSVTIEDEVDESEIASNASFEVVDEPTLSKADKGKAPAKEDVEMTEEAEKPAEPTSQETKPSTKYWISERSVGVFERKFIFKNLIDQDNVRASLENGLLTIVVPKRQAYVRQVQIN